MSSTHKRKRDELEDSDEEPSFGRQILPVANLPENYNGPITDGLQYLFTVRRDARRLPHVVRVANPYEVPDVPPPLKDVAPHPSLPSESWRTVFQRRFRNFRKNFAQPTIHIRLPEKKLKQKLMPDKNERDLWWEFIAGRPEAVWNPPKKPKQGKGKGNKGKGMRAFSDDSMDYGDARDSGVLKAQADDGDVVLMYDEADISVGPVHPPVSAATSVTLPTPMGTPPRHEEGEISDTPAEAFTPREPTPALLNRIDHRLAIHLLMYFTNWMNHHLRHTEQFSNRLTEVHARWMFALLSRVDDHVDADDMSLLRNLARACIGLLKDRKWKKVFLAQAGVGGQDEVGPDSIVQEAMSERSCWIVIAAIVYVWAQRDLWQDAEAMLQDFIAQ
ncbi:hypothetical protein NEOLEDRAFT_1056217 [Neolentinus lepideus HHB14362 ss-1]|uniref:Uncharacterized protein n=1 Tax=Neolentinus lepideus HHB14362 ss-1 TaxID=1314782 RepID=A0A165V918_9AGAM|nr:hypothetical protein NEOLEDRAFT_1056217 [Neolentinus lepideus HHB14362 ss-1]